LQAFGNFQCASRPGAGIKPCPLDSVFQTNKNIMTQLERLQKKKLSAWINMVRIVCRHKAKHRIFKKWNNEQKRLYKLIEKHYGSSLYKRN
jgi:hypothetical protein